MRLLIVKMSSFGDVVHAFPALTDLKAARPDIEVDWLVEEGFADLVAAHPAVSQVHRVALRRLRWPPARWPSLIAHRAALGRALRARRYDRVVDLQGLVKSAVMARLAGAPITGMDAASAREPAAARFYARTIPLGGDPHVVDKLRRFLAEAVGYAMPEGRGKPGLRPPPPRPPIALPDRYGLVVHGAAWPSKLWPEDRWRRLIEAIAETGRSVVLTWGGGEEEARARRLVAGIERASALPRRLAGGELSGLVAAADFAVGLDTGLMHLAAAHGVPGVTLFGPTEPAYATPYGPDQRAVRSLNPHAPCQQVRCHHGPETCMDMVPYEAVWEAVREMLAALPAQAASA